MRLKAVDLGGVPDSDCIEAIAFGYIGGAAENSGVRSGAQIQLAYRLEVNDYRGVERVQLNCQHLAHLPDPKTAATH
jgi:RecJ OB domain